jgi:hypothetical protein
MVMRKWFMSGIAGLIATLFVLVPSAMAASSSSSGGSPGQGLEISPPVIELTANPGQTVSTQIRVRNVTAGELIAAGHVDDFGAGSDENGQPKLLLNETGETRYSLKYWVSGVPNLDLAPQELKATNVVITVPADAEPGGHYGVVRFTAVPPNLQGTGVALSASVGTLILLKVNGAITHNLSMVQFAVGHTNAKTGVFDIGSFFEQGPMNFLVRVQNNGTVHEQPVGSINVTDLFGSKVGTLAVNPLHGNILPGSIRRFVETLSKKALFGYYTAKLSLTYNGTQSLNDKISFWVIPWKLVLIVILVLVVLFFALKYALKRYNEHIIAMARRR